MPGRDDDAAAGSGGPLYPEQPEDGKRPVPLRGRPERTQDPEDWDARSAEPLESRRPDRTAEELSEQIAAERDSHADGRADDRAPTAEDESSYSTEQEQGAAQPGPRNV